MSHEFASTVWSGSFMIVVIHGRNFRLSHGNALTRLATRFSVSWCVIDARLCSDKSFGFLHPSLTAVTALLKSCDGVALLKFVLHSQNVVRLAYQGRTSVCVVILSGFLVSDYPSMENSDLGQAEPVLGAFSPVFSALASLCDCVYSVTCFKYPALRSE
jgi:hypothetical protein